MLINVDKVKERIQEIKKEVVDEDFESAHGLEENLYKDVLKAIAKIVLMNVQEQ